MQKARTQQRGWPRWTKQRRRFQVWWYLLRTRRVLRWKFYGSGWETYIELYIGSDNECSWEGGELLVFALKVALLIKCFAESIFAGRDLEAIECYMVKKVLGAREWEKIDTHFPESSSASANSSAWSQGRSISTTMQLMLTSTSRFDICCIAALIAYLALQLGGVLGHVDLRAA